MTQLTESKNILEISSQPWKPNLVTFIRGLLPAAAAIVALLIHQAIPDRQDSDDTKYYAVFLKALAALAILATIVQPF